MPKWHEVFDILKGPLSIAVLGILISILLLFRPIISLPREVFLPLILSSFLLISYGYVGAKYYNKGSSKPAKYALAIYFLAPILILLLLSAAHPEWGSGGQFFFNFVLMSPLIIATAIGYLLARFAKLSTSLSDYKIVIISFIIFVVIFVFGMFPPEPTRIYNITCQPTPVFASELPLPYPIGFVNYSINKISSGNISDIHSGAIVSGTFYFQINNPSLLNKNYSIYYYELVCGDIPTDQISHYEEPIANFFANSSIASTFIEMPMTNSGRNIVVCTANGNKCSGPFFIFPQF